MEDLNQFFGSIIKPSSRDEFDSAKIDKVTRNLAYVCAKDFGWSQSDFESCDIPFLFSLVKSREEDIKEQNKQMRKKK